jgi:hypothetical protein
MSQQGQPCIVAYEQRGVRQQCSTVMSNKQDMPARVDKFSVKSQRQKSPFLIHKVKIINNEQRQHGSPGQDRRRMEEGRSGICCRNERISSVG